MLAELSGRVAVITGAASGIGRGLAQRCAEAGMKVVAADLEQSALNETAALVSKAGGEVISVPTDVSDAAAVDALAAAAYDRFGAVHLLCNNAGVFQAGVLWERTIADWEWVLGVNVWGIVHGIRAFVPRMIAGGEPGHVVNTSSLAGIVSQRVQRAVQHEQVRGRSAFPSASRTTCGRRTPRSGPLSWCPGR